jgi:thiamine biosynthesis lipoprotein ApbE
VSFSTYEQASVAKHHRAGHRRAGPRTAPAERRDRDRRARERRGGGGCGGRPSWFYAHLKHQHLHGHQQQLKQQ